MLRIPEPALNHGREVAALRRLGAAADGGRQIDRLKLTSAGGRAEALAALADAPGPVVDLTRRVGDGCALLFMIGRSAFDADDSLE